MMQTNDFEYYSIPSIQMLIEYLYSRFRKWIYLSLVPAYIASHLFYEGLVIINEYLISDMMQFKNKNIKSGNEKINFSEFDDVDDHGHKQLV